MKYIELKIHVSHEGIEQITALMLSKGIDQLTIDDPADFDDILNKKNEYGWDYIEDELKNDLDREPAVLVYFEDKNEDRKLIDEITEEIEALKKDCEDGKFGATADFGSLRKEILTVDDEDWKYKWKEFFKPSKITDKIVVKPTWEEYEATEEEVVIEIDPGMAFGTGTHETTSLCLKLMEKYLSDEAADKKVLDVGCGSGILSIGAALLGCKDVLGVEIDVDAVQVARENVELNKTEDSVKVLQGDLTKGIAYKADIIVANLMADLVMMLSESARDHLVDGGIFISSGILTEKEELVGKVIEAAGFEIIETREDGEWCAIAAKSV